MRPEKLTFCNSSSSIFRRIIRIFFTVDVSKKGEDHIISIYVGTLQMKLYLHDAPTVYLKKSAFLCCQILCYIQHGGQRFPYLLS
ncbi:hypothetical protein CW304_08840 [Bacillus sp. UFRGS-B20]|nr:hypothetical protein CW304_08840 [Bacillus sp. UFRGS-B20]